MARRELFYRGPPSGRDEGRGSARPNNSADPYARLSPTGYGRTAGNVLGSPVLRQVGWPKPLALFPVPPSGFGVMSKMMLSGCVPSPANRLAGPGTAGNTAVAAM